MTAEPLTPIPEISLRYILIHSIADLKARLEETFEYVASSYNVDDIANVFQSDITSIDLGKNSNLSLVKAQVSNVPYSLIREFESAILDENEVLEIYKTCDSFKIEENQRLLAELYNIEMNIREIYTVLVRLRGVNLKDSKVRPAKDYQDNEKNYRRKLMNEFFFIQFSDYKNVDQRRDSKLRDLIDVLRQVETAKDVSKAVTEISSSTLHLEEFFNELSRIPEAIGRLEHFRNCIAHNRFIMENDLENFEKAKEIVDYVYGKFLSSFNAGFK